MTDQNTSPELAEAAAWLVRCGYPFDWTSKESLPAALREAVIDAVTADPTRTLHGQSLTREEVRAWLAFEIAGFAEQSTRTT